MKFSGFLPALAWLILSTILLCLPGSTVPGFPFLAAIHADKWVHIGMFAIFYYLWALPLLVYEPADRVRPLWFWVIMLAGIAYGIAMEFVQKYCVVNRSFDIGDIVADIAGCVLAYFFFRRERMRTRLKKIGPDRNRDRNQN